MDALTQLYFYALWGVGLVAGLTVLVVAVQALGALIDMPDTTQTSDQTTRLKWQDDPPTEPGWYWHEFSDGSMRVVFVTPPDRAGIRHAKGIPRGVNWGINENDSGRWAGPIPGPVE